MTDSLGLVTNHACELLCIKCPDFVSVSRKRAHPDQHVSFDLTELGNKVAKIKVNQRGNLWATGHFMGKKSVMDSPLLQSPDGQAVDAFEVALSPEQNGMGNLFQDVLRVALQAQLREDTENGSKNQETGLLMKILESYIQNNRK
ncbi:hypothetical protein J4Q44_G00351610 [Coregonus suidteri]|uniref:Uncharacterized protein n=1 Tax=Coregonus suidteri TaxID=861788 RepID=A0AAN8KSQ4_9TELE